MSRIAERPLNRSATNAADDEFYSKHPELVVDGQRMPLSVSDPVHADHRREWMDLYESHGGKIKSVSASSRKVKEPIQDCPLKEYSIDLQYLYCDETARRLDHPGVPGAKYFVRSVDGDANPDGLFDHEGRLNEEGEATVDGIDPSLQYDYGFKKESQEFEVFSDKQPIRKPDKASTQSALDEIGDWLLGTAQGDFNTDQSCSQIAVNMLLGLIPIVDQVLDIRDLLAGLKHIIEYYSKSEKEQAKHPDALGMSYEQTLWINLFIIAIGCIPTVGSAVKGVLKLFLKKWALKLKGASELSARELREMWLSVIKVLNDHGYGNASKFLEDILRNLDHYIDEAAVLIRKSLDSIQKMQEFAKEHLNSLITRAFLTKEQISDISKHLDKMGIAIEKTYTKLDEAKRDVNQWLAENIKKVILGKHELVERAVTRPKGTSKVRNIRKQERELSKTAPAPFSSPSPHNRFLASEYYAAKVKEGYPKMRLSEIGGFLEAEAKILKNDTTLYRIHSADPIKAGKVGSYWSRTPPPPSEKIWRNRDAVLTEWNDGVYVEKIILPKGSKIWEGLGAPAPPHNGGAMQVFVDVDKHKGIMRAAASEFTPWGKEALERITRDKTQSRSSVYRAIKKSNNGWE